MFLNLLELPGTLWNVPELAGTLRFHLEPSASLWNVPELSEGGRGSLVSPHSGAATCVHGEAGH